MTRRDLLRLGLGAAAIGVSGASIGLPGEKRIKALKAGSRVAIVAPASSSGSQEDLDSAAKTVREWGLEPVVMGHAGDQFGYLAGTDEVRAGDLMSAFTDSTIDGIFALRGGYGCARILSLLDFDLIAKNPKALIGYSDITALLIAIDQECGFVTFHGPVASSSRSEFADKNLKEVVFGDSSHNLVFSVPERPEANLETVSPGLATGRLTGGNLTIVSSLCGTPWQCRGQGKIVFFEEIGEAPYRIDRMLTQLISAGCLKGAAGILLGQFTGCDEKAPDSAWKVKDVILDRLGSLGIPILGNCPIGHVKDKWTIPVGAFCEMDSDKKTARLLERAVF